MHTAQHAEKQKKKKINSGHNDEIRIGLQNEWCFEKVLQSKFWVDEPSDPTHFKPWLWWFICSKSKIYINFRIEQINYDRRLHTAAHTRFIVHKNLFFFRIHSLVLFFSYSGISIQLFIISFVLRHKFALYFFRCSAVFFIASSEFLHSVVGLWFLCNFANARDRIVIIRFILIRVSFFSLSVLSKCCLPPICGMTIHQPAMCNPIKHPIKSNFKWISCFLTLHCSSSWLHFRQHFILSQNYFAEERFFSRSWIMFEKRFRTEKIHTWLNDAISYFRLVICSFCVCLRSKFNSSSWLMIRYNC